MYKKSSRRRGEQPLTGWDKGRRGGYSGLPILVYGKVPFEIPDYPPGGPPPTQAQFRFAGVICSRLKVAIPEACLETRRGMSAFIGFYKPYLDALTKASAKAGVDP